MQWLCKDGVGFGLQGEGYCNGAPLHMPNIHPLDPQHVYPMQREGGSESSKDMLRDVLGHSYSIVLKIASDIERNKIKGDLLLIVFYPISKTFFNGIKFAFGELKLKAKVEEGMQTHKVFVICDM